MTEARIIGDLSRSRPVSGPREAVRSILDQPSVFAAALLLSGLAIALTVLGLVLVQEAGVQVDRAIGRTELSLFLSPQTSRTDAASLQDAVLGAPGVASASLRTRESAVQESGELSAPLLRDAQNSLPDVWVVTLKVPPTDRSLAHDISAARAALGGLKGVDTIVVDARWVGIVDRWLLPMRRHGNTFVPLLLVAFYVADFLLFFIAGRAMAPASSNRSMRALAYIGTFAGFGSAALACLLCAGFAYALSLAGIPWKPNFAFWSPTDAWRWIAWLATVLSVFWPAVAISCSRSVR